VVGTVDIIFILIEKCLEIFNSNVHLRFSFDFKYIEQYYRTTLNN